MDWTLWQPQEETLASIKELLQDALIPDSEIQKDVQTKLKNLEIVEDFTYYLLYIVGQTHFSEEIRSLSGILLKNNIAAVYNKLPQDSILKIRQFCMMLLRDSSRDVRTSISNVIYTLAKNSLNTWPDLIPFLIKSFETPDEFQDVALNTLFSICEDQLNLGRSDEEIKQVTQLVFPKFVDMLAQNCDKKANIVKLLNQFLQDYKVIKESIDLEKYLRNVFALRETDDLDFVKYACHTFVMYLDYREDCLLPLLHDIIIFLLEKTQHEDSEVALAACEFWLAMTKLNTARDLLHAYIEKLVPILLRNMKYSSFELVALKDTLCHGDGDEGDKGNQIFPFSLHEKRVTREDYEDALNEDEFQMGASEDLDDFYVGWTLRKCSAASLDAIAVKFGNDFLPLVVPYLNEMLYHDDFLVKESAILALGAISEGCMSGLKPHLPVLVQYLVQTMNDEHSTVRVITCWTLSRYVSWIIHASPNHSVFFLPVMTVLLKHFMDANKRVQRAALSAFCVFEEEAQMCLAPYVDLILEGFQYGFHKFKSRSLYLLYDAINVLASSVGTELSKSEHVNKLVPPIIHKMSECSNYSDDYFVAALECLANVIPAFDTGFLPYTELIFSQCLDIILDTFTAAANFQENPSEVDIPDKEPMHIAIDVLYSMALALKGYFSKYVINSSLISLMMTTMQDPAVAIRQSSIALYGELVLICFPYLQHNASEYLNILVKNLDLGHEGVCKNSAWVIGKMVTVMGNEMRPYGPEIADAFMMILMNPRVSRPIQQTTAIALCTLWCACPDLILNDPALEILKICCIALKTMKDSVDKDLAFRGFCVVVVRYPDFFAQNFVHFCEAIATWSHMKPDLRDNIMAILVNVKEQCGDCWGSWIGQLPDILKLHLHTLYGV